MIDAFCHILPSGPGSTLGARRFDGLRRQQFRAPAVRAHGAQGAYEGLTSLEARFRMMDEFEGYRQVISLASPSPEQIAPRSSVELSTMANDELAELVAKYPTRFAGAAGAVPMNEPDAACREIERLFDQLRLCAVQIFTNVNGRPLDAPEFRPVWKTLADKGVPVLLHPARSSTHADYATEQESKYLIWQVFGWP